MRWIDDILREIDTFLDTQPDRDTALRFMIDRMHAARPYYHWVGIYLLEPNGQFLRLYDYYIGRPTPHVRIPITRGICGAAVREQQTIVVPDVRQDPRYLACSLETQSEIVVPIRVGDRIIGEIDIDSDELNAFNEEDRVFLEAIADRFARVLGCQDAT